MGSIRLFFLLCILTIPVFCASQNFKKVSIKIGGPCLRCAPEKLYNLAKSLPGVEKVQVNTEQHLLNLLISPDVPYEVLVRVLNENGYDVNDRLCDRFTRYDPCCTQPTAQKQSPAPAESDEDDDLEDMIMREMSEALDKEVELDIEKELDKQSAIEENDDPLDLGEGEPDPIP